MEIIILGILLMLMAKKRGGGRKRPNFSKYVRGRVDEQVSMTTLAPKTLVSALFDENVDEEMRISSIKATWSLSDLTEGSGIGPIQVGIAHGDYTDAEIEEVIENTGSWDRGDLIAQEIAKRKIRTVGVFPTTLSGTGVAVLNEGRQITTKLNWLLQTGQTVRVWAYNQGSNAVATTVPIVSLQGHANLWLQ